MRSKWSRKNGGAIANYAPTESSIECAGRDLLSRWTSKMEMPVSDLQTILKNARKAPQGEISHWRVIAHFLVQSKAMDLVARLSFLEGVAGLPPGRWASRGYGAKREAIAKLGPAAENFLTKRDSGLYRYLVTCGNKFMNGDSFYSGEDLVQNEIAGLTPKGKQKKPLMWRLGKTFTPEQFVKRELKPRDAGRMVYNWLRKVAINYLTKGRPDKRNLPNGQERIEEGLKSFQNLGDRTQKSLVTKVMLDRKNPAFAAFHKAIDKVIKQKVDPGYLEVYEALVANLRKGTQIKDKDLAKQLGVDATKISKAKRRIGTVVLEYCKKNPKILAPALKLEDLSQLSTSKYAFRKRKFQDVS